MRKFGYFLGAAVATIIALSLATCIAAIAIKCVLMFLMFIF